MALTEQVTVPLEGEQAGVFRTLDDEEARIVAQLRPVRDRRNAMVTAILAGKGLLQSVQETPGAAIEVTPEAGIVISVPPPPDIQPSE